jgi:hypothetical protein
MLKRSSLFKDLVGRMKGKWVFKIKNEDEEALLVRNAREWGGAVAKYIVTSVRELIARSSGKN